MLFENLLKYRDPLFRERIILKTGKHVEFLRAVLRDNVFHDGLKSRAVIEISIYASVQRILESNDRDIHPVASIGKALNDLSRLDHLTENNDRSKFHPR